MTAPAAFDRRTTSASSFGTSVFEDAGPVGSAQTGGVDQILDGYRDAVKRSPVFAGLDFAVGCCGCLKGSFRVKGNKGAVHGIAFRDAVERGLRQGNRCQ